MMTFMEFASGYKNTLGNPIKARRCELDFAAARSWGLVVGGEADVRPYLARP